MSDLRLCYSTVQNQGRIKLSASTEFNRVSKRYRTPRHRLARTPGGTKKKELMKAQPDGLRQIVVEQGKHGGARVLHGFGGNIVYQEPMPRQRPWGHVVQPRGVAPTLLLCTVPGGKAQHTHVLGGGAGALAVAGTPSRAGPGWQNQRWGALQSGVLPVCGR
jgi:hypothetical protein